MSASEHHVHATSHDGSERGTTMETAEKQRFQALIEKWKWRIIELRTRFESRGDHLATLSQIATMTVMIKELETLLSELPSSPAHRAKVLKWR